MLLFTTLHQLPHCSLYHLPATRIPIFIATSLIVFNNCNFAILTLLSNPNHCNSAIPTCETYPMPNRMFAYTCPSLTDPPLSTSLQPHNPQQPLPRTLLDSLRRLTLPLPGISTRMYANFTLIYTTLHHFHTPYATIYSHTRPRAAILHPSTGILCPI